MTEKVVTVVWYMAHCHLWDSNELKVSHSTVQRHAEAHSWLPWTGQQPEFVCQGVQGAFMSNVDVGRQLCSTTSELQSTDFRGPPPTWWKGNVYHKWMAHTKMFQQQMCTDNPGTHSRGSVFASFTVVYNKSINLCHGIKNRITVK